MKKKLFHTVNELQQKFDKTIEEHTTKIKSHMMQLEDKINDLNSRLEEEKTKIPKDIERKGKDLQNMLHSFQQEFQIEKKDRLNREGRILKQMHDYEDHVTEKLKAMILERDEMVLELKTMLEKSENGRKEADMKFQRLITEELNLLRLDVSKETKERKLEDDEIVEALNRYTRNLQSSLSVIGSMEN